MKLGAVAKRGAVVFAAVAAACSSDGDGTAPGATCGAGTQLKNGVCEIVGGSNSTGGDTANAAGTSSMAGTSPTAGTSNDGGTGAVNNGGSSPNAGMNGGAGAADSGGAGGAEPGPEPKPEVQPPRWLAFIHQKGVFAYDTTKFPSPDGLIALGDMAPGATRYGVVWSPSGKDVLYANGGSMYAVNMEGDAPGTPRVLLSTPAPPSAGLYTVAPWAWSADSASLATVSKTTLSVLDASQAAPALHTVTTTVTDYRWAPSGNWLFYADASGEHVAKITQGTLGTPLTLSTKQNVWSPDGLHLAGIKDNEVALTTLGDAGIQVELLTAFNANLMPVSGGAAGAGGAPDVPELPEPIGLVSLQFNKDGTKLTFNAETDDPEAYVVDVKPNIGQPKPVVSNAPPEAGVFCNNWSTDGTLLLCGWSMLNGGRMFAADAAGGQPITVEEGTFGQWIWSPNPAKHQLFVVKSDNTGQHGFMVDLAAPNTLVKLYDGYAPFRVSPTGDFLSYVVKPTVNIVNLAKPQNQPTPIDTDHYAYDPPVATWSPDGHFISIADGSYQQRLVRVDGTSFSTPVMLQTTSKYLIYSAWQP